MDGKVYGDITAGEFCMHFSFREVKLLHNLDFRGLHIWVLLFTAAWQPICEVLYADTLTAICTVPCSIECTYVCTLY